MRGAGIPAVGAQVETLDLEQPQISDPHHVLIAVRAAGVANWDDIVRTGRWDVGGTPPMALGVEAAGVVRAVGTAVSRFRVGDEVMTHCAPLQDQGAWAEMLLAPEDQTARKPEAMTFAVAGVFPVPAVTAAQVLSATGVQPGETVLVHGAGGITGGMLVAVAADLGASVIATAGPSSAERVRGYGASTVLDYHPSDWPSALLRLARGGVAVAVNAVPKAAASLLPLVAEGGRFATITGDPPSSERNIQVSNVYVSPDGSLLAARFAERGLTIPITRTYSLSEAAQALEQAVSGTASGGLVLDPSH